MFEMNTCDMGDCSESIYEHGVCFYHFWLMSCSTKGCETPPTHTWAGDRDYPAGDVCYFCDACWQQFLVDESVDGVFGGSLGTYRGFMMSAYLWDLKWRDLRNE